jgi:hypothetical protein
MHGLIVEENAFGSNPGTKDIARHLFTRMSCGKAVVVADNPLALLGALRRQWLKLARKVQKERASTLNAQRIFELNEMVMKMQTLRFAAAWPEDFSADVYIATPEQLLQWAPECKTLYITCDMKLEAQHMITALMPRNGLVVICKFV